MTITGPCPNKRQRRGKDSTRYSRPTVKKNEKKSLLEEHIVYSDIIFAKIFTFGGTLKGVLTLSLQKNHFQRNTKVTLTLSLQKFLHLEAHKSRF